MRRYTFHLLIILNLSLVFTPVSARAEAHDPSEAGVRYRQALVLSQKENYAAALVFLKEAEGLFQKAGNAEGVYLSKATLQVLEHEQLTAKQQAKTANVAGMNLSWLLKDFNYSGLYLVPQIPGAQYGGVLYLMKKVRDITQGPRRSTPVWAILDAKVIPKLQAGENFAGGTCGPKSSELDGEIAAVVMTKGHEQEEKFQAIRAAWRLNPNSRKIEDLDPTKVYCINEAAGL